MHEAVVEDVPSTKRDIYYKDVPLFGKQRVVDTLVDDLAATYNVERCDLNVRATSKGLICGSSLLIHLRSGEVLQPNDADGALIPVGEDILSFSLTKPISWVLVVEKDAVFQTLCRLRLVNHDSLRGEGLMITGKGYPDLATRHLVKTLSDCLPQVPILALIDADAYGLDILSVYRYGSRSLRHEVGKLAADRIQWLGVRIGELSGLGVQPECLLPITKQDEKMALGMLKRPDLPGKWKKELTHMLFTRRKAEIEILSNVNASQSSETHDRCSELDLSTIDDQLRSPGSSCSEGASHGLVPSLPTSAPHATNFLLQYIVKKIDDALT